MYINRGGQDDGFGRPSVRLVVVSSSSFPPTCSRRPLRVRLVRMASAGTHNIIGDRHILHNNIIFYGALAHRKLKKKIVLFKLVETS